MIIFYKQHVFELILIIGMISLLHQKTGLLLFVFVSIFYILLYYNDKGFAHNGALLTSANNNKNCREITMNNPFGNYTIYDFDKEICDIKGVRSNDETTRDFTNYNVYTNSNEISIGSTNKANRQFITLPNTKYPNNINEYATKLYSSNKKCKELNDCLLFNNKQFYTR